MRGYRGAAEPHPLAIARSGRSQRRCRALDDAQHALDIGT
jgi:hypothetical protein